MKLRIFFAVLLVACAWVAGRALTGGGGGGDARFAPAEVKTGERVFNESYKLAAGARVDVSGINGPVDVVTVDGDSAEVRVVSDATDARDLERQKIIVKQTEDGGLVVRREKRAGDKFWSWLAGRSGRVNHRVELRVPRRIELRASGINGKLTVGAVEGALKISGVNGPVEVARAAERVDVSGINGPVTIGLAALSGDGLKVSGVNGPVELRLAADTNADVRMSGLSGSVNVSDPRVTVEEDERSRFGARVGTGGAPIRVSGIHGSVTLARG